MIASEDLRDLLKLSEAENVRNDQGGEEQDTPLTFDPDDIHKRPTARSVGCRSKPTIFHVTVSPFT
jgi:hypothetical protein